MKKLFLLLFTLFICINLSAQEIVKVENATYTQVSSYVSNLQSLSDTVNDNTFNVGALKSALNNLRTSLPNIMVTTYTYDPLIGITNITDSKGETIYYHYDNFNRLEFVKDALGNILSKNQYHYREQL